MRLSLLSVTAASALLICQSGAMAQTKTPTTQPNSAPSMNETLPTVPNESVHGSLRAQMRDMLQKEGFTDVRVFRAPLWFARRIRTEARLLCRSARICSLKYRRWFHQSR